MRPVRKARPETDTFEQRLRARARHRYGLPADERRHRVAALNHVAISYDYTPVTPRRKAKGGSSPTEGYS